MHFSEEKIDQHRKRPENEVVQPPDQGRDEELLRHLEALRRDAGSHWRCWMKPDLDCTIRPIFYRIQERFDQLPGQDWSGGGNDESEVLRSSEYLAQRGNERQSELCEQV